MKLVMTLIFAALFGGCAVEVTLPAPSAPDLGDGDGDLAAASSCRVLCVDHGALRVPSCSLACPDDGGDVATTDNQPIDLTGDPPATPSTSGSIGPTPGSGGGIPCGNPH